VLPNENLVADGIPPISDALAVEATAYSEARSATPLVWHPQKREMLITTRFADTPQIHSLAMPGGDRRQLTFFPDRVVSALYSPDPQRADHFVFSKDFGGAERFQLYRYDVPSGVVTLLTDSRSRNLMGRFSRAGVRLAYTSTRRNGRDADLYAVDPRDPKGDRRVALLPGGGWETLDWSPDSRRVLLQENLSASESYLWLVDSADGTRELVTPLEGGPKIRYQGGAFAADGRSIYTATDKDGEYLRLAHINLTTKETRFLTSHIPWDVERFEITRDGRTIAVVTNEEGAGTLHLLDGATGRERAQPRLPPGSVREIHWRPNGRELAFGLISVRHPEDVFTLDVGSGKVERWTRSETGGIDTSEASQPDLVKWTSFDGRQISGYLYLPPARFTGPRPVMIEIHGGPEGQYRPTFLGRQRYFLDVLGVALLYPNVRGSTGYGKSFAQLDDGLKREDAVKDIGALLDWIRSRSNLDSTRVMVSGGSYGGYMSLAVSYRYADRLRCSLDVVGISSFVSYLEHTEPYRRDLRRAEYGDERDPTTRAFFERTAPLSNVQKITRPIFVVAGRNDPRVPAQESDQIVAALKKQKTPVWYLVGKDEGHGFARKKNSDYQFLATIAFLKRFLLN
jgi:dipeptidyl aminopeptidase/acylaminoacyl peptidase